MAQLRPELVTAELAELLSKTDCHMVAFDVESGSEHIRTQILGRKVESNSGVTALMNSN